MSADWWFENDPWQRSWNVTYNLNPMLREAGWTWPCEGHLFADTVWCADYIKGARAADIGEKAMYVLRNLEAEPEKYRAMNPPNGWGSYDGLLTVWRDFVEAIRETPDAILGGWF